MSSGKSVKAAEQVFWGLFFKPAPSVKKVQKPLAAIGFVQRTISEKNGIADQGWAVLNVGLQYTLKKGFERY
jgi:hypothetical protein